MTRLQQSFSNRTLVRQHDHDHINLSKKVLDLVRDRVESHTEVRIASVISSTKRQQVTLIRSVVEEICDQYLDEFFSPHYYEVLMKRGHILEPL